jgi:hypothetical protein
MGERQEDRVDVGQRRVDGEPGRGEVAMGQLDRLVVPIASLETGDLDIRVAREDPDQLRTDVAGCADDPDADAPWAVTVHAASLGTGRTSPAVRRDRRGRPCAHGRTWPLTGGGIDVHLGWTAVMVRMTIHRTCILMQTGKSDVADGSPA